MTRTTIPLPPLFSCEFKAKVSESKNAISALSSFKDLGQICLLSSALEKVISQGVVPPEKKKMGKKEAANKVLSPLSFFSK